ncbi:RNF213 [Branchiostoma lanceolatum]|uniref:RNF213 protein n=1 Tax=Branchiostoma lanceolatum TaxID=7740 RepID=A0A8J9ZNP1_BRALA|nr:RNF213 [Branchiostoma lanceolatum]
MVTRSHQEAAARQQAFEQTKLLQVEFFLYVPEFDDYSACGAVLYVSDNGQKKNYPLRPIVEKGLSSLTVEDLPSTCIGGLKIMVPQLLSAAETVEPWLWLLGNCSKLFDTGNLIQLATSNEFREWSKKRNPAQYIEQSKIAIYNLIHGHQGGTHRDRLLVAIQKEAPDIDTKIAIFEAVAGNWQDDESLQSVLEAMSINCTTSVEKAIRSLKGPKEVDGLYQLWRKVDRMGPPVQDMIATAVMQLASKSSFSQDQTTTLQMMMTDRKLFSSKKALDLFKVIAASKDQVFQSVFLALAHDKKMSQEVDKEDAKELSVKWLQVSIEAHCTTSRKYYQASVTADINIPKAYENLLKIMATELVGGDQTIERALGEVVKGFIRKFGWQILLTKCEDMKNMTEQVQGLYKEHLEEMIKQDGSAQLSEDLLEIACSICDIKPSKAPAGLDIKYKLTEDLLVMLMNFVDLPERKLDQDMTVNYQLLLTVIGQPRFWLAILNAKGRTTRLHKHQRCKAVSSVLIEFGEQLQSGCINIQLFRAVVEKASDVKGGVDVLALLIDATRKHAGQGSNAKPAKNVLRDINKQLDSHKQLLDDTDNLLNMFTTMVEDLIKINDISHLRGDLQRQKKRFKEDRTLMVTDLTQPTYLGKLYDLREPAHRLNGFQKSYVFRNVLRKHFAEMDWREDEGEDHENSEENKTEEKPSEASDAVETDAASTSVSTPPAIPMVQFVNSLSEEVVDKFKEQCQPLTEYNSNIPLGTVQCMFAGITNADKMEMELTHLDHLLCSKIPFLNIKALKEFVEFPKTQKKVHNLSAALQLFQVSVESTSDLCTALQLCEKGVVQDTSLSELHRAVDKVEKIICKLSEEDNDIVEQLSRSSELLAFLRDIVEEDLRNLIDAVEEHSEQFVNESTVSNLIDVKRYLQPLLKDNFDNNPERFIQKLQHYRELSIRNLPEKINDCSINFHSLKGLYASVANRGEMTKEIAHNAYMKGQYTFDLNTSSTCKVTMSYDRGKTKASHSMSDLRDLRSRALLIVNSDKGLAGPPEEVPPASESSAELSHFIKCVDLASSIAVSCESLHSSGHFKYRTFQMSVSNIEELEDLDARLRHEYENWQEILKKARREHYYLNYLYSDQLWILDDFFNGDPITPDLSSLFHFIHPSISVNEDLRKKYTSPKKGDGPYKRLCQIGSAMDKICGNLQAPKREMKEKQKQQSPSTTTSSISSLRTRVQPGKVFVAALDVGSSQVVNIIMNLYESTTGSFPEPHQIIICSPDTKWEELHLLLQRCVGAPKQPELGNCLFCIANVELLQSDIQFRLVDEIKQLHSLDSPFLMALVCRGGTHHPILDQFSRLTHRIQGMSDVAMRQCFSRLWPSVKMVTSDIPGLGKTEFVQEQASKKGMGVVSFPLGGTITRDYMVKRLSNLKIQPYQVLHLDISPVDDPHLLDAFIFELIVVGAVHSGTDFVQRPTEYIIMEVANTLNHALRNTLVTSMCFERVHLKWENYQNFIISPEVNSPVQVVCHYLDALDRATIDETDIPLSGPKRVTPLPAKRCKDLLRKYFSTGADLSFTIVEIFLSVLADQLKKFSASQYFRTANLRIMLGDKQEHQVRRNLFTALLEVSKEFASRSVVSCRSSQSSAMTKEQAVQKLKEAASTTSSAMQMVSRVEGMIRWADSNHLMVIFHSQDAQTVSALYRSLQQVPIKIQDLFKQQVNRPLPEFSSLTQGELQMILERIARTTSYQLKKEGTGTLDKRYALTPDNLLKMALVIMRVRARIPVIIMGETGCGKTSLIRYLAKTCEVPFKVLSIHAGVTEDKITAFVTDRAAEARKDLSREVWAFLDEINTCDHLGLINEVICHHSMLGKKLPENLILLAACNPYRQRESSQLHTAGLEGKARVDEYSKLVYRVHPLPESMLDYVWDYGTLNEKDERSYITKMVTGVFPPESKVKPAMLVDLLALSQNFIRRVEGNQFGVSLRDVNRCRILIRWFVNMLNTKGVKALYKQKSYWPSLHLTYPCDDVDVRSVILTLAHCYHSRLADSENRAKYRKELSEVMRRHNITVTEHEIEDVIHREQLDLLKRMELPEGTAKNGALCENVFVILVCILNRIPIFVVGKPGCSKSLSMQLIRSNLRGRDSSNEYFKKLPQLYVVSHQGSESSTSEGIIKVFDKAKKYKEHNEGGVLPVVLLDEIGLAEESRFNPLKVLHSLLEPAEDEFPDVAVVGISNWALDAAKMNRAVHLSRPEPDTKDLYLTGKSLAEAALETAYHGDKQLARAQEKALEALAEAYFEYEEKQTHKNFHGLRDYYSLIKCICLPEHVNTGAVVMTQFNLKVLKRGLLRNFGGLSTERETIIKTFQQKLRALHIDLDEDAEEFDVKQLIQDNLRDKQARHLMLITSGDSAVGILEQMIRDSEDLYCREQVTIFGSHLDDDLSEDYDYRTLSRIILCMERGCILILRDLDSIYGSLYDMLNQNYTVVGKKRNCRVALGAYSNPMCQVHENFRCIVLIDQQKVNYSDPPFLNRFEKQLLRFSDVINPHQMSLIKKLECWVDGISTIPGQQFTKEDLFIGFHDDTLPSLVLWHSNHGQNLNQKEVLTGCKADLMWIASPDGMLRASKSSLAKTSFPDIVKLQEEYFNQPTHRGLQKFLEHMLRGEGPVPTAGQDTTTESGEHPDMYSMQPPLLKLVIHTFSNVHTDIEACLEDFIKNHTGMAVSEGLQVEKLSAFKSEKQLSSTIQHFWLESKASLLILQCSPSLDGPHMLLAKSQLDHYRNEYIKARKTTGSLCDKHVCLLIHVEQGGEVEENPWQLNFLCGWQQVTLDSIEEPTLPIKELLNMTVREVLESTVRPFADVAREQLMWCFTCFKYRNEGRPVEDILKLVSDISDSPVLMEFLKQHVYTSAPCFSELHQEGDADSWQVQVACDRQLLHSCSGLQTAMQQFISLQVRQPLAKAIFLIESQSAWESFFSGSPEQQSVWIDLAQNGDMLNFDGCPDPCGPESCDLPEVCFDLKFPFSLHFLAQLEKQKDLFFDEMRRLQQDEDNLDEDGFLKQKEAELQVHRFVDIVDKCIPDVFQRSALCNHLDLLIDDFCNLMSKDHGSRLEAALRTKVLRWAIAQKTIISKPDSPQLTITDVVTCYWRNSELFSNELQLISSCVDVVKLDVLDLLATMMSSESEPTMAEENAMEAPMESLDDSDSESFIEEDKEAGLLATGIEVTEEPSEQGPETVKEEDISVVLLTDEDAMTSPPTLDEDLFDTEEALHVEKEKLDLEDSDQTPTESNDGEEEEESHEYSDGGFEESSTISERLVEVYCTAMLPEKSLIDSCGGLKAWHAKVTTLLSLAAKTAKSEGDNCMNSQPMFSSVVETARKLLNSGKISSEQLQQFLCLLFGRCLDANPDTILIDSILNELSKLPTGSIRYAGPVLDRILYFEQESHQTQSNYPEHLGLFQEIIEDQDLALEEHPPLQSLNICLHSLQSTAGFDSHLATLCSDIIQDRFFSPIAQHAMELGTADNLMFNVLVRAAKVIREATSCDLQFICSVAFIRAFLTGMAGALQGMLATQEQGEEMQMPEHLLQEVNTQLFTPSPKEEPTLSRKASMVLFFLKQLRPDHGLLGLRDVSKDLGPMLPALQELEWEKHELESRFPFGPLRYATGYEDAMKALALLKERDGGEMNALIQKAKGCEETRFSLLATLYDFYFLVRTVRPARDTEKAAAQTIAKMISDFPRPYKQALLCTVGEQDSKLCVSEQSSLDDILKKSVIMHLLCALSSSLTQKMKIQSPFQQYLTNPEKLNAPYVLAIDNNDDDPPEVYTATNQQMWDEKATVWSCSCGFLVAQQSLTPTSAEQQMVCPVCKSPSVPTNHLDGSQPSQSYIQNVSSGGTVTQQTGYVVASPEARGGKWSTVRQLSPVAYRCLHLLVHGCLLASHYAEVCKPEQLGEFIFKDHDKGQEAIDICTKFVDVDWKALGEVISGTSEDVCRLLHSVIQRTNSLLNGSHKSGQNTCNTREEREKWEEEFSAFVDKLVQKIPSSLREQQVSALSEDIDIEQGPKCLEIKVEELERGVNREYHHDHALRLFRVTEMRTFEKLHCHFMNGGRDLQDAYPFLGLFFSMHEQLPYIKHLHPLLRWTTIVKSRLSHRLAKEKAKDMQICEFIYDSKLTKQEKEHLKKSFQEFKEAWNQLHGSGKVVDGRFATMPPMHEERPITECLLDPQIPDSHLQTAISVLYNLQNKFLTNVAKLAATTTCPAVSFLVREQLSSVIPQVPILDVKKKDVIHYTWSNEFMKHSECNTEYGLGRQLFFDFSKIEMELANTLVLGKAYINDKQGLPKFAYANELFSASASILHDICNHLPQEPLATDTVNALRERNESDRIAKPLLEHMEVVLFLLKRTKGKPSEPLVDYTKKWLSMLTSPFPAHLLPEPHSAIQLKNVVHLYETLEDMMADVTIESLHDCFRQKLKSVMQSKMENATTEELERAVKVTRQFVFRYMSSSDSAEKVKPGSLLLTHLVNTGLWTADQKETSEDTATTTPSTFMGQLNVEHVYAALEAMTNTIGDRRQRERNMFQSFTAKKTHQTQSRRATRKKMRYSNT